VLQGTWRGAGSPQFANAMNQWEDEFMVVLKELSHMIELMGGNARQYDDSANEAEGIAADFTGGLPGF
jgi:uncharacterized protein YukE